MTIIKAAQQILRAHGTPMHYRDLTRAMIEQKLVTFTGATPHFSVHSVLSVDTRERLKRGEQPRFTISNGMVSLLVPGLEEKDEELLRRLESRNKKVGSELLKRLLDLSSTDFEQFVATLLGAMGYENVQVIGGSRDLGVDLTAEMRVAVNVIRTAIQAKRIQLHKRVGVNAVKLLRDSLPTYNCTQGVVITTSTFAKEAVEVALEQGRPTIVLIDGQRLAALACEHQIGVSWKRPILFSLDEKFDWQQLQRGARAKR